MMKLVRESLNESHERISKAEILEALKDRSIFGWQDGFGFVKMNDGHFSEKTYKNWEGKSFKGFKGGSIGPMTLTTAHKDHNRNIEELVRKALVPLASDYGINGDTHFFKFDDGKKGLELRFRWHLFPTYTNRMDLDPGYQQYWFVGSWA